jgi:hypothetical protein
MPELAVSKLLGFRISREENGFQVKKKNDINSIVPSQTNIQKYKDSDYYLDSISAFAKNQSLTSEQIAESRAKAISESRAKAINDEINALRSKYEISNFEEVKNFLSKNHFLISLLEEIPNKIYQYYKDEQRIALEVFYEPDFPQSSELWVSVLTELSAEEARSIMNKIDEDWWLENIERAKCKMNIGIDYV